MAKSKSRSGVAQRIIETALQAMAPYVPYWIETLGRAGAPPNKRGALAVGGNVRVQAAKSGMDFLSKYLEEADEFAGQDLLEQLRKMGELSDEAETGPPEPDGTAGRDWPGDPDLPGEDDDLVQGLRSNGRHNPRL